MKSLESEKQMIQSTNPSTPEIVAELQSILNQLEDSTDDVFDSIQKKLKIDLMKEDPFSQNPNCETYSFSFFVQHFVFDQKLQKIELLSFMELRDRFEDGEMIYLNQTTEKFRGQVRFKFEEFYKKLLRDERLTLSETVKERKILLELIGTLDREKFTNKIEGYSILKTLGKVFGDELTGEIFWIPLLQQLKREEENLARERKLPESNITHKSKISSFISICERIAHNDFEQSLASLPYFKLLSEGVHKLRFII